MKGRLLPKPYLEFSGIGFFWKAQRTPRRPVPCLLPISSDLWDSICGS